MSDETRGKLLSAQEVAKFHRVHPDRWADYNLDEADLFGHVDAIEARNHKLVAAGKQAVAEMAYHGLRGSADKLRAAIEENDDGK